MKELQLTIKGARFVQESVVEALKDDENPNADPAFDFGIILAIITALVPIFGGSCFASRIKESIKTGDTAFILTNFKVARSQKLSPAQSVRYVYAMKTRCAEATDDDIDEFIQLCQEIG